MSVGLYLREARLAAGYSVEEIAAKTRIRAELIRDLELEKFELCGGNAYARAHIRTIGQLINANVDLLIREFEATTGEQNRPMIDLLSENNATALNPQRAMPKMTYKFMASSAAVIVGLMILVPTASSLFKSTAKSAHPAKVSIAAKTNSQTKNQFTTQPAPTSAGNLVISAVNGTSWVAVTDQSGANLFTGKISNGQVQSFDASQLINVTLGNSGALSITVNGKSLGVLGAVGEVKYLQFGPGAASPVTAG